MIKRILIKWEVWLAFLFIGLAILTISIFVWRISDLYRQGVLNSFEATSLILQSIVVPVSVTPALAVAVIAVSTLRAQRKALMDARRPIVDLRVISTKPGSSQFENAIVVQIINLGPGPGLDVEVSLLDEINSTLTQIGIIGSEISGDSSTIKAEIKVPISFIGKTVHISASYLDLFANRWKSTRSYSTFPTGEGVLTITKP